MFARTAVARLRATSRLLAVSPYAIFLKQQKGQFMGLPVRVRSRKVAAVYHALPAAAKAKLAAEAKRTPYVRKPKPVRKPRKLTAYNKFVRANYASVAKLPYKQRLGALAKKWAAEKK